MANADGSVIIKADIDDKQAQRELNALTKKIDALQEKLNSKKAKRDSFATDFNNLGAQLDEAKVKLDQMKNSGEFFTSDTIKQQEETVASIQKRFDKMDEKLKTQDESIKNSTNDLGRMKDRAGELATQIASAKENTTGFSVAAEEANKRLKKLSSHMKTLARRVLVFSLIAQGLRTIKDYLWESIQANDKAVEAIANLKGALLTLAQPIVEIVIPAFTLLVNVISRIINTISKFVSLLFGTTLQKSAQNAKALNAQKKAIDGVGSAAKKAAGSLAGFDELDTISSSGDASNTNTAGIAPNFSGIVSDQLSAISELFVGILLVALGAVLTFSGANIPLGLAMMVIGGIAIWGAISENWGVIKEALQGELGKIVALVSGALLAIGLILLLTGASVPIGLGLIIAGAAGLATVTAANWGYIVQALKGPLGELVAVVSTEFLALGAVLLFSGVGVGIGLALLLVGAAGLASTVYANWDTIVTALKSPIGLIVGIISASLLVLGVILLFSGVGIPLGLGLILAGATGLAASIFPNWDFLKDKVKEIWNGIKSFWRTYIAPIFTATWWQNLAKTIMNGFISGVEAGINWILSGFGAMVNGAIGLINSIPGISISPVSWGNVKLPRLAQGAVIPPNREFLAILGDQKHGTNIEAPLDTIQQAAAQAFGAMGPQFAEAIVAALAGAGLIGDVRDIRDSSQITAAKEFSLGSPSSSAGRWIEQSSAAYAKVRG